MISHGFFCLVRLCTLFTNGVIGGHDSSLLTEIAFSRLSPWFVLAVLFAPFNLIVTSSTQVTVGQFQNLEGLFGLGVVCPGKRVLMGGSMALLFLAVVFGDVARRHGAV